MTYYATLGGDVVKALRFDEDCDPSETPWLAKALADDVCVLIRDSAGLPHTLKINTSEGVDTAERGDWVLRNLTGFCTMRHEPFVRVHRPIDMGVLTKVSLEAALQDIRDSIDRDKLVWRFT